MKVRASYKLIGRNPFKIGFDDTDYYTKTVEVPENYNLNILRSYAIQDTKEGYEFIQLSIIEDINYDNNTSDFLLPLSDLLDMECI